MWTAQRRIFGGTFGGASEFVSDVLAGKERIIPFDIRSLTGRNTTSRALVALNFARAAFQQEQRAKGRIDTFFNSIAKPDFVKDVVSICDQWSSDAHIDITELCHLPLFKTNLKLDKTKYGAPSVMQLKLALREVQSSRTPAAMIVSRAAGITLCMKIPVWTADVFLVMDLRPDPSTASSLSLVLNTSFEETVGRLSGILPIDDRLLSRDMQWQAQLTASCGIHIFSPIGGGNTSKSSAKTEVAESIALLMSWVEASQQVRNESIQIPVASSSRREAHGSQQVVHERRRTTDDQADAGPSARRPGLQTSLGRTRTSVPYEQAKRHAQIFFLDDLSDTSLTIVEYSKNDSDDGEHEVRQERGQEEFECGVCFDNIPVSQGISLDPCQHGFCRSCITGHVCAKISERRFPVFCPLCAADRQNADPSAISGSLVQRLDVTEEEYSIWAELEMAQLGIQVHCRRCSRSAYVDRSDYDNVDKMTCPFPHCDYIWCKNCHQEIRKNGPAHSCDGSSEFKHLVQQMGWKQCPRCKTPVQKTGGCNHMTCVTPGCNSHFCYKCGKQITRSPIPFMVSSAITSHYRHCSM